MRGLNALMHAMYEREGLGLGATDPTIKVTNPTAGFTNVTFGTPTPANALLPTPAPNNAALPINLRSMPAPQAPIAVFDPTGQEFVVAPVNTPPSVIASTQPLPVIPPTDLSLTLPPTVTTTAQVVTSPHVCSQAMLGPCGANQTRNSHVDQYGCGYDTCDDNPAIVTPTPTTPTTPGTSTQVTNPLQYVPSSNPLCDSVNADPGTAAMAGCLLYGNTNTGGYTIDPATGNIIDPSTGAIVGNTSTGITSPTLDLSNPWLWLGGGLVLILLFRGRK